MKLDWNRKYTTIAVYTFLTAVALLLVILFFVNFGVVRDAAAVMNRILAPVFLGVIFAYLINPIMRGLEKHILRFRTATTRAHTLKRGLSITLTYIIVFIILAVLLLLIIPQVYLSAADLVSKMNGYLNKTLQWLDTFLPESFFGDSEVSLTTFVTKVWERIYETVIGNELTDIYEQLSAISDNLEGILSSSFTLLKDYVPQVFSAITNFASGFLNLLLGIFFSVYFLASKEKLIAKMKKLLRAFTTQKMYDSVIELARFSDKTFGGFLVGKIIDSVIIGILMFIVCSIVKIPYAILVSVLVGFCNIIPVIGPFIGAIPGTFIIFIVDPMKAFWFIVINIIIQQLDGNIIGPKILGQSTGVSALGVLFSITVMGGLWGLLGMLIAVPCFAIVYSIVKIGVEKRLVSCGLSAVTSDYYAKEDAPPTENDEVPRSSFADKIKQLTTEAAKNSFAAKLVTKIQNGKKHRREKKGKDEKDNSEKTDSDKPSGEDQN